MRKLLQRRRRAKRLERELGTGLWRQAHDRYVRGLDRFHQILEGVEHDDVHNQLVLIGDQLAGQLPRVYAMCKAAHQRSPSADLQVPPGTQRLHSGLSRAANHLATTAEAEAMLRLDHAGIESVRRRAEQVMQSLQEAEANAPADT